MNLKRAGTRWKNREMLRKKKKRDKEKTQEWQIKMSVPVLTD